MARTRRAAREAALNMLYLSLIAVIIGIPVFRFFAGKGKASNLGYLMIGFPVAHNLHSPVDAWLLASLCCIGVMLVGYRR